MFETDLLPTETNEIIYALGGYGGVISYLEIGVNFGGTFKNVIDHCRTHCLEFQAVGVDLFEDFVDHLDDPNQTHRAINPDLPPREGAVVHDGTQLRVPAKDTLENALVDSGCYNFELLKGNSDTVVSGIDKMFNVIFIDGNHTYDQTKLDFEAAVSKCVNGGMIFFHNASKYEADNLYTDGGPWKLCCELRDDARLKDHGLVERLWRFQKK